MIRTFLRGLAVALALVVAPAAAQVAEPEAATIGTATTLTVQHEGLARSYLLYVPNSLKAVTSRPAVLLLHGNGGSGKSIMGWSGLNALAESEGFVAIYPQTVGGRGWNDGRPNKAGYDDLGYIQKVVAAVVQSSAVNVGKVFVAGASSGGFMTQRLACEASTEFRAAGVVIALLTTSLGETCAPEKSLPMVFITGDADPVVPFTGDDWVHSQPETMAFWKNDGVCDMSPGVVALPDLTDDGTTVSMERRRVPWNSRSLRAICRPASRRSRSYCSE